MNDKDYCFNERQTKDLRNKYRSLIKSEANANANGNNPSISIYDIRSVNEKVTEVFIGADWSSAQWQSVDTVPNFEILMAAFEEKIASKQKLISRVSPARTPSRFISSLAINSAVKRTKNAGESSQDEADGTPLKKTKTRTPQGSSPSSIKNSATLTSSPLSIRSVKSAKSAKSSKSNTKEAVLLHSENEEDVVYPDEEGEPTPEPKSVMGRCIIM